MLDGDRLPAATAAATNAVDASCVLLVPLVAVGAAGVPVNVGDATGARPVTADCTNAVLAACVVLVPEVAVGTVGAPVSVGDASGANPEVAAATNAVLASCVVLVPGDAVGAVGVPVNPGDASGAALTSEYVIPVAVMSSFVSARLMVLPDRVRPDPAVIVPPAVMVISAVPELGLLTVPPDTTRLVALVTVFVPSVMEARPPPPLTGSFNPVPALIAYASSAVFPLRTGMSSSAMGASYVQCDPFRVLLPALLSALVLLERVLRAHRRRSGAGPGGAFSALRHGST